MTTLPAGSTTTPVTSPVVMVCEKAAGAIVTRVRAHSKIDSMELTNMRIT